MPISWIRRSGRNFRNDDHGYIFNIIDDDFSDQEGWTYYMEESTGTRSTVIDLMLNSNSTEMSDS